MHCAITTGLHRAGLCIRALRDLCPSLGERALLRSVTSHKTSKKRADSSLIFTALSDFRSAVSSPCQVLIFSVKNRKFFISFVLEYKNASLFRALCDVSVMLQQIHVTAVANNVNDIIKSSIKVQKI